MLLGDYLTALGVNVELRSLIERLSCSAIQVSNALRFNVEKTRRSKKRNASGDLVTKLDAFAQAKIMQSLRMSKHVHTFASEELEQPTVINKNGTYDVYVDPLDGSKNAEINVSSGTIFCIFNKGATFLDEIVASGYFLYGPSLQLVLTFKDKDVSVYTLTQCNEFVLTKDVVTVPQDGSTLSVNVFNADKWDRHVAHVIQTLSANKKLRYVGSFVADAHRTLLEGGLFAYPSEKNDKLRIMFELAPLALIFKNANGSCQTRNMPTLSFAIPKNVHDKAPVVLGSFNDVQKYVQLDMYR